MKFIFCSVIGDPPVEMAIDLDSAVCSSKLEPGALTVTVERSTVPPTPTAAYPKPQTQNKDFDSPTLLYSVYSDSTVTTFKSKNI